MKDPFLGTRGGGPVFQVTWFTFILNIPHWLCCPAEVGFLFNNFFSAEHCLFWVILYFEQLWNFSHWIWDKWIAWLICTFSAAAQWSFLPSEDKAVWARKAAALREAAGSKVTQVVLSAFPPFMFHPFFGGGAHFFLIFVISGVRFPNAPLGLYRQFDAVLQFCFVDTVRRRRRARAAGEGRLSSSWPPSLSRIHHVSLVPKAAVNRSPRFNGDVAVFYGFALYFSGHQPTEYSSFEVSAYYLLLYSAWVFSIALPHHQEALSHLLFCGAATPELRELVYKGKVSWSPAGNSNRKNAPPGCGQNLRRNLDIFYHAFRRRFSLCIAPELSFRTHVRLVSNSQNFFFCGRMLRLQHRIFPKDITILQLFFSVQMVSPVMMNGASFLSPTRIFISKSVMLECASFFWGVWVLKIAHKFLIDLSSSQTPNSNSISTPHQWKTLLRSTNPPIKNFPRYLQMRTMEFRWSLFPWLLNFFEAQFSADGDLMLWIILICGPQQCIECRSVSIRERMAVSRIGVFFAYFVLPFGIRTWDFYGMLSGFPSGQYFARLDNWKLTNQLTKCHIY